MYLTSQKTGFMDIRIQSWAEVNPEDIARFTFQIRHQEGLITENTTIDTYLTAVDWWITQSSSTPIIAYIDDQMVGWLVFFSFVSKIATIGRWHPIVAPGPQQEKIAQQLLKASISHAKEQKFERLEAELTGITSENESSYKKYEKWYHTQGFHIAAEESRLEKDLTQEPLPKPTFPPKFQLQPLSHFTNQALEGPFFNMFNNSKDRFWLDQTQEQRKESFNFWFDRKRAFVEEATGVLLKGDEIIGLTVVRPIQDIGMLGPIAILPEYRRRGLGRALLAYSFQGTLKSGIPTMQLEFDVTNEPAHRLYQELGFHHVHQLVIFAHVLK